MRAMNDLKFDSSSLYRNGSLLLVLVFLALVVHNIFGQNGYLAARRQQKELQTLQQQILQLKHENDLLDKENRSLKSDPAAIERMAREQMHLAKAGEKIYTLPDNPPANPVPGEAKEAPARP